MLGSQVSIPPVGVLLGAVSIMIGHFMLAGSLPDPAMLDCSPRAMWNIAGTRLVEWLERGAARVVLEVAPTAELFKQPLHPYTQALLAAIPAVGDGATSIFDDTARLLEGELPNPIDLPRGCRFASRCPHRMARCDEAEPDLREAAPGHAVACYLYTEGGGSS